MPVSEILPNAEPARQLVRATDRGLYCERGGFYIDPWRPVDRAIITHAHSDHAIRECGHYLASPTNAPILRIRLGPGARVQPQAWGEPITIDGVRVSFHPAGHVLGSAMIRIEPIATNASAIDVADTGGTWLVSGDYKVQSDTTCEPCEPVACDTFLTESTFALPIFRWSDQADEWRAMNEWWRANAEQGTTSLVYAYSLGKAQRVLSNLDPSIGPIGVHGAVAPLNEVYRDLGKPLPAAPVVGPTTLKHLKGRGLIVAPPGASQSPTGQAWARKLVGKGGLSEAIASGWMRVRGTRRWRSIDRGLVISDHADWPGLLATIRATGASRVGVTHGSSRVLAKYLNEQGTPAFVVPTRYTGESAAEELLDGASGRDTSAPRDAGPPSEGGA